MKNVLAWRTLGVVVLGLITTSQAFAQWSLEAAESQLSFITVKAEHVAEVHSFQRLEGGISAAGAASVSIDLTSVETGIAIRNERMQSMLFETGLYPSAQVSAQVDAASLAAMAVGETRAIDVELTLSLHGESSAMSAAVLVTRVTEGLRVATLAPVIVSAESFSLTAGVESLREIAGLPSIGRSVPVTFSLLFTL
ncbi:MAG: YceI family protein [Gammaproteobacteria bacterium]|jgi:hypothetical protein|nr:YceI family protein [Gammaproteobacteria bacterium]